MRISISFSEQHTLFFCGFVVFYFFVLNNAVCDVLSGGDSDHHFDVNGTTGVIFARKPLVGSIPIYNGLLFNKYSRTICRL